MHLELMNEPQNAGNNQNIGNLIKKIIQDKKIDLNDEQVFSQILDIKEFWVKKLNERQKA